MTKFSKTAAVSGVIAFLSTAQAFANHVWGNYHWARTNNPFTLELGNNLTSPQWHAILGPVSADWSASSVLDTSVAAGSAGTSCKPKSGTVQVCNRKYGFNGWLGLAQVWVSGTHILQATVKVNDSYFGTKTYNDANAKRHVLCQEVGHTFGLGHQPAVSCMDDVNGLFDAAYFSPNSHDYEQLELIYSSLDETSTVASALTAAAAFDAEGPNNPGELGGPATGRVPELIFMKELGRGAKLFSFVFPAPPPGPSAAENPGKP
jgi:hypothetical protein